MKASNIIVLIVIVLCFVSLCVIVVTCAIPNIRMERDFNNGLSQMESETQTVPVYVTHKRNVNINGSSFNIGSIIEEIEGQFWDCKVVYADTRVWFVYAVRCQNRNSFAINIASVSTNGTDFQIHYSAEVPAIQNSDWAAINIQCRYDYYPSEWCYYHNGKIVVTNKVSLFEYDLQTSTASQYDYSSYQHPSCAYDCEIKDRNTIVIATQNGDRIITPEDAANISTAFAKMLEIGSIEIWDKTPSLLYLFDSVQFDGSTLYIVCRMHSYYGEAYAVAFQYEYDKNELYYCFSHHTSGPIEENLYIVPTASTR